MKSSTTAKHKKEIGLIVLSVIDVLTGILSLVIAAFAVQVIAIMASGLTLVKAIKVAVQSEKTAVLVKPVAIFAVRKLTRSEKMKNFFKKLKDHFKNNPVTIFATVFELVICGGLGYMLLEFFERIPWAAGWKLYALAFGAAFIVYGVLFVLTYYLGYDSDAFANIRKAVKVIGGEKAVEVLDLAENEIIELQKTENERKAAEEAAAKAAAEAEAAKKAEEDRIYKYALEQEEKKKAAAEEIRRAQLVNAYTAEFKRKEEAEKEN